MRIAFIVLAAVPLLTPGAAAGQDLTVPLDGFLPFEDDCRVSAAFGRWAESLSEGVDRLVLTRDPEVPAGLDALFGPAQLFPPPSADALGVVEVPVTGGSYHGLPVAAIRITEPNGVPRSDYAVRFAADLPQVAAALAPLLEAEAARADRIGQLTLGEEAKGPTLRCVVDF